MIGIYCIFFICTLDSSVLSASSLGLNRNGPILLDTIQCNGTENTISDCLPDNYVIGSHDCSHGDDVILFCEGIINA